jgi:hypothetical protein
MTNQAMFQTVRRDAELAVDRAVDTSQSGVNPRAVDDNLYMIVRAGGERQHSSHPGLTLYLAEVP